MQIRPVRTTNNANIKIVIDAIDKSLGHKNYSIKVLEKSVAYIEVCIFEDYQKVKFLLEELKVHFYTYNPKSLLLYTAVIEGLPESFES